MEIWVPLLRFGSLLPGQLPTCLWVRTESWFSLMKTAAGNGTKNFFGIPAESYGFSNRVPPTTYAEAGFSLREKDHVIAIKLR